MFRRTERDSLWEKWCFSLSHSNLVVDVFRSIIFGKGRFCSQTELNPMLHVEVSRFFVPFC